MKNLLGSCQQLWWWGGQVEMFDGGKKSLKHVKKFHSPPKLRSHAIVLTCMVEVE